MLVISMNKKQDYINHENITLLDSISNFKGDLSKKTIKNYIKNKMVKVNDKVITNSSYPLKDNDKIEISYSKKVIPDYNLDILYEDEYLIIINKPCGLLSIGNDKEKIVTAYRMVSDYVKHSSNNKYIFVVHRLDQDTSGILMFAKNEKIRDKMQDNWNTTTKKRGYIAIVDGILKGTGTKRSYLMEDRNQFVYSSKNNHGKEAITHYSSIKSNNNYSLVQVFIDTGRRNQIRVQLKDINHPIAGDTKYGIKDKTVKRMMLHAACLEIIDPITKKKLKFEAKYDKSFTKMVE